VTEELPICNACKVERSKEGQPPRELIPFTLEKFRYKLSNGKYKSRDTAIPMFLCSHCDEATIESRRHNLSNAG
jgi:Fe-S-cluster-containing dehydrogenase component